MYRIFSIFILTSLMLFSGKILASTINYIGTYSLNFAAPVVTSTPSITDNPLGSIVFDTTNGGSFKGLFSNGWNSITYGSSIRPTVQRFTSGDGTYYRPTSPTPIYIRIKILGAGGGGGGGAANGTDGSAGSNSSWGSTLLVAGGGSGGQKNGGNGGSGGTNSFTSGPIIIMNVTGGSGSDGQISVAGGFLQGSVGGGSVFGSSGANTPANTGSGGKGGYFNGAGNTGAGGGSGGYIEAIIPNPIEEYSYSVGGVSTGNGGAGGTNGGNGYSGSAGIIIVEEYYQ